MEDINFIIKQKENSITFIMLEGILDSYTSHKLSDQIKILLEQSNFKIILDFSKVEYMSSAGIGALLDHLEELRKNDGDIGLINVSEKILKVLDICGVTRIVNIFGSGEEAESSLVHGYPPKQVSAFPKTVKCPNCNFESEVESSDVYKCLKCDAIFQVKPSGEMDYLKKGRDLRTSSKVIKTEITIQSDAGMISSVRSLIKDMASKEGFNNDSIYNIELAVDEALANIIEHAYNYEKDHPITIEIIFTDEMISVVIIDFGKFIKADSNNQPEVIAERKILKRGRGTLIMRSIMDKVEYDTCNDKANKLVMVKYRKDNEFRKFQSLK